ncbi:sulfurtransferase TusA [Bacterioplanes sanyensis]|uniref:Sulfurtransferase TusA n=1 Tax=Bacterioplanes sanyensis TaxID=1249553 RepID=A0A222FN28_9GAMM|nr:sulfurtransferase TusA [Bacterioplanes sanyensis]ASP40437.1 sulfurtransferase TusA [Bacterioplanes sanyensis]
MSEFEQADVQLDTRGLFCPEPVMMLHGQIDEMAVGQSIAVLATDPSTQRDFLKFCSFLGHELVCSKEVNGEYQFLIRKGEEE